MVINVYKNLLLLDSHAKAFTIDKEYSSLMTNPKKNEEINEELSAEELKDVSAGLMNCEANGLNISGAGLEDLGLHDAKGTGSEMNIKNWAKANQSRFIAGEGT